MQSLKVHLNVANSEHPKWHATLTLDHLLTLSFCELNSASIPTILFLKCLTNTKNLNINLSQFVWQCLSRVRHKGGVKRPSFNIFGITLLQSSPSCPISHVLCYINIPFYLEFHQEAWWALEIIVDHYGLHLKSLQGTLQISVENIWIIINRTIKSMLGTLEDHCISHWQSL